MDVKRNREIFEGRPDRKVLDRDQEILSHQTCKGTSGGVIQWESAALSAWSRTQQSVSVSSAETELYALTPGIFEGMGTKHLLKELICEGMASKRGLGRMEHVMLQYMFVHDVVEKNQTKTTHIASARERISQQRRR